LLRQAIFGRLAGYKDVNDAERLCRDLAMRSVAGGRASIARAASTSQMGRFETEWLTRPENLAAHADLSGLRIEPVHKVWNRLIGGGHLDKLENVLRRIRSCADDHQGRRLCSCWGFILNMTKY
jgi:hypothetical protein